MRTAPEVSYDLSLRDVRQRAVVPPEALAGAHAVVVGVGAIGRQVALQLAAVGVGRLTLVDFDVVSAENLAVQGYAEGDLGSPKAEATARWCRLLHGGVLVRAAAERFRRGRAEDLCPHGCAAFACVDSIETRRLLWEAVRRRAGLFVDGRLSAEVVRVLACAAPALDGYYETTLFPAREAYAGACTARSTIYAAAVAAGLMVGQLTKWLRGLPNDSDLALNLLSAELTALGPTPAPP
jgi:molybdopterin-synthase adenylyltransferase